MNRCEHSEKPAAARCVDCGTVLCQGCKVQHKGRNFCEACVPIERKKIRSPNFSMFLSLIPGLGQFYAGSYFKGLLFMGGAGACLGTLPYLPAVVPLAFWFFSVWDARMSALKRNYKITRGRVGSPGATDGDWMMFLGTLGLSALYLVLPFTAGVKMDTWVLWVSFVVIMSLSALLGRGGKNVKTA